MATQSTGYLCGLTCSAQLQTVALFDPGLPDWLRIEGEGGRERERERERGREREKERERKRKRERE